MLVDTNKVQELLKDESLGAGNLFFRLEFAVVAQDAPLIELDRPYRHFDERLCHSLSYYEISIAARQLAGWYYYHAGIQPKDPVAIYLDDGIQYFLHYLALTRIGAIPTFVNSLLAPEIADEFIRRTGATVLVTNRLRLLRLTAGPDRCTNHLQVYIQEEISPTGSESPAPFIHAPDDPVLIAHTSGTTGIPKAVQFNHEGFFFGVKQQLGKSIGRKMMSALPQSHGASISMLMSWLLRGNVVRIQVDKSSLAILRAIEAFKPDLFVAFPKVYVDLCRQDLNAFDLRSISYWLSTGDANHESHIKQLVQHGCSLVDGENRTSSVFIDNLGASEFGFAMFRAIHSQKSENYSRCIGRPFEWLEAEVLDEDGSPMQPNVVGRLGVKSKSVTPGYWNNSLLTEKTKLRGYWLTGDLVYKDEKGKFYHVDRIVDQILTPDGVLYSCQTEELLLKHFPEIFDCSIVGQPNPTDTSTMLPVLFVELRDKEIDLEWLHQKINGLLGLKGMPAIHHLVVESSDVNMGVTGKKLKRKMRVDLEPGSDTGYFAPTSM